MKLDLTLDRAVLLRMTSEQIGAFDAYVPVKKGTRTRTSAMRDALWLGLAVLEKQAMVEAEAALAAAKARVETGVGQ